MSMEQNHDVMEDEVCLNITGEPTRGGRFRMEARIGGKLIHSDSFNPHDAKARARFARDVVAKVDDEVGPGAVEPDIVERLVLDRVDRLDKERAGRAGCDHGEPEYFASVSNDPERHGIYRHRGDTSTRLTNFTMEIEQDVLVEDDVQNQRRFEGTIGLGGVEHPFSIAATDFADPRKLQATIFAAAGPEARLLGDVAVVRDAVSALSQAAPVRMTTAPGWTPDGSMYLTATGVVDSEGLRAYHEDEPQVALGDEGVSRWLGLKRLKPAELAAVKGHLVEDFYRLHARPVMATVLAVVSLAVLMRFANNTQRVAIWLKGLTGAGKSFVAKLAMSFFGDYDLADGGRFVSWASTANYIERTGYWFRDALYLVDDYKPELVPGAQAIRVMQAYADGSGRGRLQKDARSDVTRPIRGLLLCTGEDLPQNNASALARTIIVEVPNQEKDLGRAERCLAARPHYRGVMADFLRWLIAEGRVTGFAARVDQHCQAFYQGIAGQQNDARIAGNFALLAAAFEEFALYLGDAWDDREAEVQAYVEGDLPATRDAMLGIARAQQAAVLFLDTLRELLAFGKVRLQEAVTSSISPRREGEVVGKIVDGDICEIHTALALGAVQEQLHRMGREKLKVSAQTLIGQLAQEGVLLPVGTGSGNTHVASIDRTKVRCFRIHREVLFGEAQGEPAGHGDGPDGDSAPQDGDQPGQGSAEDTAQAQPAGSGGTPEHPGAAGVTPGVPLQSPGH
jgi:hypothetical protein